MPREKATQNELKRLRDENDMLRQRVTALALFVEAIAATDGRYSEDARELLRLVHESDE